MPATSRVSTMACRFRPCANTWAGIVEASQAQQTCGRNCSRRPPPETLCGCSLRSRRWGYQQFPPMALLSYTTLALRRSAGRFDFNLALMSMPKRPKLSASQAENLPQVSSGHTTPMTHGKRYVIGLRSQTGEQGLRGIHKDHRVGLCETNIERFKQLPHRMKAVIIEQRSHPLPQQPLAAKLGPHGPKQGTTELLRLIHQKRQHHQHGKHHGEVLLAVTVVVLKVVALVLERVERLIFDLPACPATPYELVDVALAYAQVRHPTEVLHLLWTSLPVLDEIDPYVSSRPIEWHVIDKAKRMDNLSGAVMPLIIGDVTRFFGRLHLRKQVGMVTLFHP